jgi:hypothetical protein
MILCPLNSRTLIRLKHFLTGLVFFSLIGGSSLAFTQSTVEEWANQNERIRQLIQLRSFSHKEIRKEYLKGKEVIKSRGKILLGKRRGKTIYDKDGQTLFTFHKNQPILISQTNYENRIDPSGESLQKTRQILGKPEAVLEHHPGGKYREFVYPSHGIAFIIEINQSSPISILIFQPTTLKTYKKLLWDEPRYTNLPPLR